MTPPAVAPVPYSEEERKAHLAQYERDYKGLGSLYHEMPIPRLNATIDALAAAAANPPAAEGAREAFPDLAAAHLACAIAAAALLNVPPEDPRVGAYADALELLHLASIGASGRVSITGVAVSTNAPKALLQADRAAGKCGTCGSEDPAKRGVRRTVFGTWRPADERERDEIAQRESGAFRPPPGPPEAPWYCRNDAFHAGGGWKCYFCGGAQDAPMSRFMGNPTLSACADKFHTRHGAGEGGS